MNVVKGKDMRSVRFDDKGRRSRRCPRSRPTRRAPAISGHLCFSDAMGCGGSTERGRTYSLDHAIIV